MSPSQRQYESKSGRKQYVEDGNSSKKKSSPKVGSFNSPQQQQQIMIQNSAGKVRPGVMAVKGIQNSKVHEKLQRQQTDVVYDLTTSPQVYKKVHNINLGIQLENHHQHQQSQVQSVCLRHSFQFEQGKNNTVHQNSNVPSKKQVFSQYIPWKNTGSIETDRNNMPLGNIQESNNGPVNLVQEKNSQQSIKGAIGSTQLHPQTIQETSSSRLGKVNQQNTQQSTINTQQSGVVGMGAKEKRNASSSKGKEGVGMRKSTAKNDLEEKLTTNKEGEKKENLHTEGDRGLGKGSVMTQEKNDDIKNNKTNSSFIGALAGKQAIAPHTIQINVESSPFTLCQPTLRISPQNNFGHYVSQMANTNQSSIPDEEFNLHSTSQNKRLGQLGAHDYGKEAEHTATYYEQLIKDYQDYNAHYGVRFFSNCQDYSKMQHDLDTLFKYQFQNERDMEELERKRRIQYEHLMKMYKKKQLHEQILKLDETDPNFLKGQQEVNNQTNKFPNMSSINQQSQNVTTTQGPPSRLGIFNQSSSMHEHTSSHPSSAANRASVYIKKRFGNQARFKQFEAANMTQFEFQSSALDRNYPKNKLAYNTMQIKDRVNRTSHTVRNNQNQQPQQALDTNSNSIQTAHNTNEYLSSTIGALKGKNIRQSNNAYTHKTYGSTRRSSVETAQTQRQRFNNSLNNQQQQDLRNALLISDYKQPDFDPITEILDPKPQHANQYATISLKTKKQNIVVPVTIGKNKQVSSITATDEEKRIGTAQTVNICDKTSHISTGGSPGKQPIDVTVQKRQTVHQTQHGGMDIEAQNSKTEESPEAKLRKLMENNQSMPVKQNLVVLRERLDFEKTNFNPKTHAKDQQMQFQNTDIANTMLLLKTNVQTPQSNKRSITPQNNQTQINYQIMLNSRDQLNYPINPASAYQSGHKRGQKNAAKAATLLTNPGKYLNKRIVHYIDNRNTDMFKNITKTHKRDKYQLEDLLVEKHLLKASLQQQHLHEEEPVQKLKKGNEVVQSENLQSPGGMTAFQDFMNRTSAEQKRQILQRELINIQELDGFQFEPWETNLEYLIKSTGNMSSQDKIYVQNDKNSNLPTIKSDQNELSTPQPLTLLANTNVQSDADQTERKRTSQMSGYEQNLEDKYQQVNFNTFDFNVNVSTKDQQMIQGEQQEFELQNQDSALQTSGLQSSDKKVNKIGRSRQDFHEGVKMRNSGYPVSYEVYKNFQENQGKLKQSGVHALLQEQYEQLLIKQYQNQVLNLALGGSVDEKFKRQLRAQSQQIVQRISPKRQIVIDFINNHHLDKSPAKPLDYLYQNRNSTGTPQTTQQLPVESNIQQSGNNRYQQIIEQLAFHQHMRKLKQQSPEGNDNIIHSESRDQMLNCKKVNMNERLLNKSIIHPYTQGKYQPKKISIVDDQSMQRRYQYQDNKNLVQTLNNSSAMGHINNPPQESNQTMKPKINLKEKSPSPSRDTKNRDDKNKQNLHNSVSKFDGWNKSQDKDSKDGINSNQKNQDYQDQNASRVSQMKRSDGTYTPITQRMESQYDNDSLYTFTKKHQQQKNKLNKSKDEQDALKSNSRKPGQGNTKSNVTSHADRKFMQTVSTKLANEEFQSFQKSQKETTDLKSSQKVMAKDSINTKDQILQNTTSDNQMKHQSIGTETESNNNHLKSKDLKNEEEGDVTSRSLKRRIKNSGGSKFQPKRHQTDKRLNSQKYDNYNEFLQSRKDSQERLVNTKENTQRGQKSGHLRLETDNYGNVPTVVQNHVINIDQIKDVPKKDGVTTAHQSKRQSVQESEMLSPQTKQMLHHLNSSAYNQEVQLKLQDKRASTQVQNTKDQSYQQNTCVPKGLQKLTKPFYNLKKHSVGPQVGKNGQLYKMIPTNNILNQYLLNQALEQKKLAQTHQHFFEPLTDQNKARNMQGATTSVSNPRMTLSPTENQYQQLLMLQNMPHANQTVQLQAIQEQRRKQFINIATVQGVLSGTQPSADRKATPKDSTVIYGTGINNHRTTASVSRRQTNNRSLQPQDMIIRNYYQKQSVQRRKASQGQIPNEVQEQNIQFQGQQVMSGSMGSGLGFQQMSAKWIQQANQNAKKNEAIAAMVVGGQNGSQHDQRINEWSVEESERQTTQHNQLANIVQSQENMTHSKGNYNDLNIFQTHGSSTNTKTILVTKRASHGSQGRPTPPLTNVRHTTITSKKNSNQLSSALGINERKNSEISQHLKSEIEMSNQGLQTSKIKDLKI